MRSVDLVVLAVAGLATPPPMSGHVTIAHPWFRALPANLPAGGYFELRNTGRWPARLMGASSRGCGMLILHKSEQKNGVDIMSDVNAIDISAGGKLRFSPGGYHLMCMNPRSQMKPGAVISVRLNFSDGSHVMAQFLVRNASGA